eukprot:scaffold1399_cov48-Cyclotella_meneghiniana.AAC.3
MPPKKKVTFDAAESAPKKRVRKKCTHQEGCTNIVVRGGLCKRHGAQVEKKKCTQEGCINIAYKGGLCIRHGAKKKKCTYDECSKYAQKGGLCIGHGAQVERKKCTQEGCETFAQKEGLCCRHGAQVEYKKCTYDGCSKYAQSGGLCVGHGAQVKKYECTHEGCTNIAQKGGLCIGHGAQVKKCTHDGCTNVAKRGGLCRRHGGKCSISNCNNFSLKEGKCLKHCANVLLCGSTRCMKIALAGGLCSRHGKESQGQGIELDQNVAVPALPGMEIQESTSFDCVLCCEEFDVSELNTCGADNACACIICHTCLKKRFRFQYQRKHGQVIHYNPNECPCCRTDGAFSLNEEEQFALESAAYDYDDSSIDANFYASSDDGTYFERDREYDEETVGGRSYYSEGTSVGGETNYSTSHEDGDSEWSEGDE